MIVSMSPLAYRGLMGGRSLGLSVKQVHLNYILPVQLLAGSAI